MTTITKVLTVPTQGAYYYEDLQSLQSEPKTIAKRYTAEPVTPGFQRVREPAEAVSVGLVLEDGQVVWGDCVGVTFSGKSGRDPVFRAQDGLATLRQVVEPVLVGRVLQDFREVAEQVDALIEPMEIERQLPERETGKEMTRRELLTTPTRLLDQGPRTERVTVERQIHSALRYGVSQALFRAAAHTQGIPLTQLICEEWNLPLPTAPISIHAQCGADRFDGADKMFARRVASLPHSLAEDIPNQIGENATGLVRYAKWLKARIQEVWNSNYRPTIHLDVHGALGQLHDHDLGRVLGVLYALEQAVQPFSLRVESPLIMEDRQSQIEQMKTLREYIRIRGMEVRIVADEWANSLEDVHAFIDHNAADMIHIKMPQLGGLQDTVEAVLACKSAGVDSLLGGSCAETDLSARVSAHVALATQPEFVLAKPGMGVDEGITIISNEMKRTLAQIAAGEEG